MILPRALGALLLLLQAMELNVEPVLDQILRATSRPRDGWGEAGADQPSCEISYSFVKKGNERVDQNGSIFHDCGYDSRRRSNLGFCDNANHCVIRAHTHTSIGTLMSA